MLPRCHAATSWGWRTSAPPGLPCHKTNKNRRPTLHACWHHPACSAARGQGWRRKRSTVWFAASHCQPLRSLFLTCAAWNPSLPNAQRFTLLCESLTCTLTQWLPSLANLAPLLQKITDAMEGVLPASKASQGAAWAQLGSSRNTLSSLSLACPASRHPAPPPPAYRRACGAQPAACHSLCGPAEHRFLTSGLCRRRATPRPRCIPALHAVPTFRWELYCPSALQEGHPTKDPEVKGGKY